MFAEDDDKGDFGVVSYSIIYESGATAEDFNITMDTGRVETAVRLDYETTPSYILLLRAIDMDSDPGTQRWVWPVTVYKHIISQFLTISHKKMSSVIICTA